MTELQKTEDERRLTPMECMVNNRPMTEARQMNREDLTREDCRMLLDAKYSHHIIALKHRFTDRDFFLKLEDWGLAGKPEPEKKEQRPATISPPVIGPEPGPAPLDPSKFIGYPPRRYENICGRPIITVARTFVKIARGAVVTAPEQYQDPDTHFRAMVCLYAPDRGRTILIKPGENGHRFSVENRTKCTNSVIGSTAPGVYNALIEFGIPLPTHYEARWDDALGGWLGHLL